jgi:hypothetical protein
MKQLILGIASCLVSVPAGLSLFVTYRLVEELRPSKPNHASYGYAEGIGIVLLFVVGLVLVTAVVGFLGLALGGAGMAPSRKARIPAVLGILLNGGILLGLVATVVRPFLQGA